jgi:SAM-dependent methyltransferase
MRYFGADLLKLMWDHCFLPKMKTQLKGCPLSTQNIQQKPVTSPWLEYNNTNRRDEAMARIWVDPLVRWLLGSAPLGMGLKKGARVLDFGCGYLDAGIGLNQRAGVIDGFDIDSNACDLAEDRLKGLGLVGKVYRSLEEIPLKSYDLIVVNSVAQYFGDLEGATKNLALLCQCLGEGGQMVIADIIPPGYSPYLDGLNSLWISLKNRCLLAMIRHLWHALTKKSDLALLRYDPTFLKSMVEELGMNIVFLRHNLTPSPFRYSVVVLAR